MSKPLDPSTFNPEGHLKCTVCKLYKDADMFCWSKKNVHRNNRSYRCRGCRSAYYQTRKPAVAAQSKAWIENNKERYKESKDKWLATYEATHPRTYHRRYRGVIDGRKYDWVVYKLVFATGHYYFGSTCQLRTRLSVHKSKLKHGNHTKALNQMVGVTYEVEILHEGTDQAETREQEYRLLDIAMTDEPTLCLNRRRRASVRHGVADPTEDIAVAAALTAKQQEKAHEERRKKYGVPAPEAA